METTYQIRRADFSVSPLTGKTFGTGKNNFPPFQSHFFGLLKYPLIHSLRMLAVMRKCGSFIWWSSRTFPGKTEKGKGKSRSSTFENWFKRFSNKTVIIPFDIIDILTRIRLKWVLITYLVVVLIGNLFRHENYEIFRSRYPE